MTLRQRGKKYGVKMGKRVLLRCQYEQVKLYKDGYIACEKPTGHYQIFNLKTQAFLSRQYVLVGSFDLQSDRDSLFQHGICQACSDINLCGFIDRAEHWVIPPIYEHVGEFYRGLANVVKGFKTGYINPQGNVIVPIVYDFSSNDFMNGFVAVYQAHKTGVYNQYGKLVVPLIYDERFPSNDFHEGLMAVKQGKSWGFVDTAGRVAVPLRFEYAYRFKEGLALVKLGGKCGFVDANGQVIIPFEYDGPDYTEFSEGAVLVARGITRGFIDRANQPITRFIDTPLCASTVSVSYQGGSARVRIPTASAGFEHGYARVQNRDCLMGLIDRTGREVVPMQFYSVWVDDGGIIHVSDGKESRVFTAAPRP